MDKVKIVRILAIVAIGLLVVGNIVLGLKLWMAQKENEKLRQSQQLNTKVLQFADLFISKVLRAQGEISFDERLKIENAVRDTHDQAILDQWEKFVGAQDEADAREQIKNLLQLLIRKVSPSQGIVFAD
jgi:hypothetical protein